MLWNASALNGYTIVAADGQIGKVAGLMYDESDWAIRWLVADTGDWLSGRRMLLPAAALGQPDPETHCLPVDLTMRQVEESPDIDDSLPLSRESEAMVRVHYDPSHRPDRPQWGGIAEKPSDMFAPGAPWPSTAAAEPEARQRETGVHSLSEVTGDSIEAADGDVGHADDFLIDTALWQVRYLTVHKSTWWTEEKRLISPLSIDWIDRVRSIVHLHVTCQKVKDSPPYIESETVDGAFEELFHSYYGIHWARR